MLSLSWAETEHLWVLVLVTDPVGEPSLTVIVAVSSWKDHKDNTVILMPGDHPFVQHKSVIFYPHAQITKIQDLNEAVQRNSGSIRDPCTPAVLQRIQEGLLRSPFTPNKVKTFSRLSIDGSP